MKLVYDGQIVFLREPATSEFWARQWLSKGDRPSIDAGVPAHVGDAVSRWIKPGTFCLEAGCGAGNIVHGLSRNGWPCVGVDFAIPLVNAVKRAGVAGNVLSGDVRQLPFPDESFGCYISQGVIEHFPAGYGPILSEMDRILIRGGIGLISFPAMNMLRRLKLRLGAYAISECHPSRHLTFYQFALDARKVGSELKSRGYELLEVTWYESVLGLADELPAPFNRLFGRLNESRKSHIASALRRLIETTSLATGYCAQLVVRKPAK